MSNAVVGTQMECLLPEHAPHPKYTLWNRGPVFVYVDSIPAVSSINSYGIAPGGTIVWDEDIPLYAVTRFAQSTLTMFVNEGGINGVPPVNSKIQLGSINLSDSNRSYTSPLLECAVFSTLAFNIVVQPPGFTGNPGNLTVCTVQWYNDLLQPICVTEWVVSFDTIGAIPGTIYRNQWQVKGSYFRFKISGNNTSPPGWAWKADLNIDGYSERLSSFHDDGKPYDDVDQYTMTDTALYCPSISAPLSYALPNMAPTFYASFFNSAAISTAGYIQVQTTDPSGKLWPWTRIPIPAGGQGIISAVVTVPIEHSLTFACRNYALSDGSGLRLVMTWPSLIE